MSEKSLNWLTIVSILLISSCHQETVEEEMGCSCRGKATEVVTDVPAQITSSGGRYITLKEAVSTNNGSPKTLFLCDTSRISGLATSKTEEYNYLVSSNLRPPCANKGFVYVWNIELTSIRKR